LTAVELLEFTWILRVAPPRMSMVGVPLKFRAPDLVGCSTTIGIGDLASTRPHTAKARTGWKRAPLSKPEKYVCTRSSTSTRMNGTGARAAGGNDVDVDDRPETAPGKLTLTRLPGELFELS